MHQSTSDNLEVQQTFDGYPAPIRERLLALRQLILEVAAHTPRVGTIEETLKWGQISYLTTQPKSGTTIRIDKYRPDSPNLACFVHCKTSLVDTFRSMQPDGFRFEGNRAVIWNELDAEQTERLKEFIRLALTYHQRK